MVSLKVSDIDSKRMLLRVAQGKGRKDRYAMLCPLLLDLQRDRWRIAWPGARDSDLEQRALGRNIAPQFRNIANAVAG